MMGFALYRLTTDQIKHRIDAADEERFDKPARDRSSLHLLFHERSESSERPIPLP